MSITAVNIRSDGPMRVYDNLLPPPSRSQTNMLRSCAAMAASSGFAFGLGFGFPRRFLSLTATPYPLYYDLVLHRPSKPPPKSSSNALDGEESSASPPLDRAKRRYLRKRRSRLLPDPDGEASANASSSEMVELRPEVVDFPRLHAREEALFFHDAFSMPWEKDTHYRMLYRLEKKYFPHHSLDKAFVSPDHHDPSTSDDKGLVFFDDDASKEKEGDKKMQEEKGEVLERKVEEFFRCLKKVPSEANDNKKAGLGGKLRQVKRDADASAMGMEEGSQQQQQQPYLVSRRTELPPRWDGPTGTVVLIDKPKGDAFLS